MTSPTTEIAIISHLFIFYFFTGVSIIFIRCDLRLPRKQNLFRCRCRRRQRTNEKDNFTASMERDPQHKQTPEIRNMKSELTNAENWKSQWNIGTCRRGFSNSVGCPHCLPAINFNLSLNKQFNLRLVFLGNAVSAYRIFVSNYIAKTILIAYDISI